MAREEKSIKRVLEKTIEIYKISKIRENRFNDDLIDLGKTKSSTLEKFDDIKSDYISDAERYMELEKCNLKLVEKHSDVDAVMYYRDRIKAFYNYVSSLTSGNDISIQRNFSSFVESIKKELVSYYKNSITIMKQKKVMYNKENKYLNAIKDVNYQEYKERMKTYPTPIEMDALIIKQYDTEIEKQKVENYLKKNECYIDAELITDMSLLNESVFVVANKIFPGLDNIRYDRKTTKSDEGKNETK